MSRSVRVLSAAMGAQERFWNQKLNATRKSRAVLNVIHEQPTRWRTKPTKCPGFQRFVFETMGSRRVHEDPSAFVQRALLQWHCMPLAERQSLKRRANRKAQRQGRRQESSQSKDATRDEKPRPQPVLQARQLAELRRRFPHMDLRDLAVAIR